MNEKLCNLHRVTERAWSLQRMSLLPPSLQLFPPVEVKSIKTKLKKNNNHVSYMKATMAGTRIVAQNKAKVGRSGANRGGAQRSRKGEDEEVEADEHNDAK